MSAFAASSALRHGADFADFHLTESQKALIRASYRRVEPAAELVATLFFLRLFDAKPGLRTYFEGPIKPHAKRFADMMKLAVNALNHPRSLVPTMKLLGTRFRQQGMPADGFKSMEKALIWTLRQSLETSFDSKTKQAWKALLDHTTRIMEG